MTKQNIEFSEHILFCFGYIGMCVKVMGTVQLVLSSSGSGDVTVQILPSSEKISPHLIFQDGVRDLLGEGE